MFEIVQHLYECWTRPSDHQHLLDAKHTIDVGSLKRVDCISAPGGREIYSRHRVIHPVSIKRQLTMNFATIDLAFFAFVRPLRSQAGVNIRE